jgi:acetylornithine deacetylase/succinyl-diaminopimelate desuccinylase-like protein
MLLKNGFKPRRSVILAFGVDEESGGQHVCFSQFHNNMKLTYNLRVLVISVVTSVKNLAIVALLYW